MRLAAAATRRRIQAAALAHRHRTSLQTTLSSHFCKPLAQAARPRHALRRGQQHRRHLFYQRSPLTPSRYYLSHPLRRRRPLGRWRQGDMACLQLFARRRGAQAALLQQHGVHGIHHVCRRRLVHLLLPFSPLRGAALTTAAKFARVLIASTTTRSSFATAAT